ncbi:hypothetical protein ACLOJK_018470 [Asimina triloba]
MCIAVWDWESHPNYPLLLLLNRDEYHNRPTKPVSWWEDSSNIIGGKDCLAGGTWLACSRDGRLVFLTNVREPEKIPQAKSRGFLAKRFLEGTKSPLEFANEVMKEGDQYNGFNLILADLCSKTMIYVTNRPKGDPSPIREVSPGIHVLSNANLDSPWPKAQRLGQSFEDLLKTYNNEEILEDKMVNQLMGDCLKADREKLPETGCDPELELKLSSIFIDVDSPLGRYGTRSMAAISVKHNGEVRFYEKYLEEGIWKEHTFDYLIEKIK